MILCKTSLLTLSLGLLGFARARNFTYCTDNLCQNCPVSITNVPGYPACEEYDTGQVLNNQGFERTAKAGWKGYWKVPQEDFNCASIVRSPASVAQESCGHAARTASREGCFPLTLEDTFFAHFCCGTGDCSKAGSGLAGRGAPSDTKVYSGGQLIDPVIHHKVKKRRAVVAPERPDLLGRAESVTECDGNWKPEPGYEEYTTSSLESVQVAPNVRGPGSVTVTQERSVAYTQSMDIGLDIKGILSLGVGFSIQETTSQSKATTVQIAEEENGALVWLPTLKCTRGGGTCDGKKVSGTICTGFHYGKFGNDTEGDVVGLYHVVNVN